MRFILFITHVFVILKLTTAYSNCYIKGVVEVDWMLGHFYIPKVIDDIYRGPVTTFDVRNITEIFQVENGPYLDTVLSNNKLTFYTSSNYENFEYETIRNSISTSLTFNCSDNTSASITFNVNVRDVNNHRPALNKDSYEYSFGMDIPKDFDLTIFSPINGTDRDFTNRMIYFTINDNEDFNVTNAKVISRNIHFASLTALRDIQAPYRREFTLSAADRGSPNFITTANIIVTVSSNVLNTLEFSKDVYYGNYVANSELQMDEPVRILKGWDNTTKIRQNNYTDYFKVFYNKSKDELTIKNTQVLPKSMILQEMLVLNIEAETPGITYPSRTTVVIRTDGDFGCFVDLFGHSYNSTYIAIGVSVGGVVILIILNIIFFGVWYKRQMKRFGFV